jgi:hypothetical protein
MAERLDADSDDEAGLVGEIALQKLNKFDDDMQARANADVDSKLRFLSSGAANDAGADVRKALYQVLLRYALAALRSEREAEAAAGLARALAPGSVLMAPGGLPAPAAAAAAAAAAAPDMAALERRAQLKDMALVHDFEMGQPPKAADDEAQRREAATEAADIAEAVGEEAALQLLARQDAERMSELVAFAFGSPAASPAPPIPLVAAAQPSDAAREALRIELRRETERALDRFFVKHRVREALQRGRDPDAAEQGGRVSA